MTRDDLGRIVRSAWIEWALQQPVRKPSWLVLYDELSEADKEADRQIAEAVLGGVGWQPMRMEWRLRGGTFPPNEDTWSIVDYWTGLQIAEVPEKYEVRALYAMLPAAQVAPAEPAEGEAVGLIAGTGLTLLKEGYAATVWPVSTGDIQDDTVHRLYTSPDREAATREAVIEECAKVAEVHADTVIPASHAVYGYGIAKAIRALAQQAKPQQTGDGK